MKYRQQRTFEFAALRSYVVQTPSQVVDERMMGFKYRQQTRVAERKRRKTKAAQSIQLELWQMTELNTQSSRP